MNEQNYHSCRELLKKRQQFARVIRQSYAEALKDCPSCHYQLLEKISLAMEVEDVSEITVQRLSIVLEESPQALSRTLRTLEQDDLIVRYTKEEDRRKAWVRLSDHGIECVDQCNRALCDFTRKMAVRLGPMQLERITEDLEMIFSALEQELADRQGEGEKHV